MTRTTTPQPALAEIVGPESADAFLEMHSHGRHSVDLSCLLVDIAEAQATGCPVIVCLGRHKLEPGEEFEVFLSLDTAEQTLSNALYLVRVAKRLGLNGPSTATPNEEDR